MKKFLQSYKSIIIIGIVSVILSFPLFNNKLNVLVDDGVQHLCRLIGTWQSITEHGEIGSVFSDFCNSFGYSWNIFYSPLTAYIPLILKLFIPSFIVVLKISLWAMLFLSGIAMYLFTSKVSNNKNVGILSGILYMVFPYHLTDMYIRIAFAEHASFIFLPLIFLGLYEIINENKKSYMLIVGTTGMILTHNIITIYTAIFAIIYILANIKKIHKEQFKWLVFSAIFVLCITSFYWVGLLEHKLSNANYEVFIPGRMERTDVLKYYKLNFLQLIFTNQGMAFDLGILTIIGVIITPISWKKIGKKGIYLFSLICGLLSVFMTLDIFPFEKMPQILKMIQFSFRMLEFAGFFLSYVVAVNLSKVFKNFRLLDTIVLSVIAIILVVPLTKCLQYKDDLQEQRYINGVRFTENTGRVHAGMASLEYLPHRAFENKDYLAKRDNDSIILDGSANKISENKKGSKLELVLENVENNTKIELPYIYYLGYTIKCNENNIEAEESENGFLQINLPEMNKATITVSYTGTVFMRFSVVVSLFSILVLTVKKLRF